MKSPALTLPPTASLTQFLRCFCATGPTAEPALMTPWIGPGKQGGVVTAASDGETACVWTQGKAGPFPEWSRLSQFGAAETSPLSTFRPMFAGAGKHALGLAQLDRKNNLYRLQILTGTALLDPAHVWALRHCDAAHLGHSTRPLKNGNLPAVSLRAVLAGKLLHGVLICRQPA